MGCAASSPASVIDGITVHNNQNAQECVTESAVTVEAEVSGRCSDTSTQESGVSKAAKPSPAIDRHSSFKDLENSEEPIIIKADAQGLLQPSGKPNADGTIPKTEGKKGFVAFEVNLDGVVEPTLESSRRQLPKRLKEQGEDAPLEFEREDAAQGRILETGRSNNSESQENTDTSDANSPVETEDKDELTIEQPAFEVLDNNNSNNNAQVGSSKVLDRAKGAAAQRLMNRRSIVQRPLRGSHPKEHEEGDR
ncbi:unnamed protein product [Schistocephalus solidus]|uniref:Uncharacterized protein n=1 Tax=Schistocephalus solidus TaxID=70667 RepID=A0A183SJ11_SCHSO|nr:unnamed protein product [Schistocephalus solidus]